MALVPPVVSIRVSAVRFVLAALLLISGSAVADVTEDLRQLLSSLQSLSARFDQRVTDTEGFEIQAITGTMTVARPGNIYWKANPPYEQVLVGDGKSLWLYDKDLEQVTVRPFMKDIANSPAMLFIGETVNLDKQYRVSRADGENGISIYTLIPKDGSAVYIKLLVSFAGKKPVSMELWDSLGQITHIAFKGTKLNKSVNKSLFRFKIPAGADVLYND